MKNSTDGITTTLWFRGAEANMANAYGAATAQMVNTSPASYGLAPYANLTVMETADGAPNGYAAPGMIFLSPAAIGKDVNANVLANQVARQWWEIQVSPVNRNHMWLENGMALYSEALWTEHEKGAAALEQRMKDLSVTALTVDNVPLIQTARLEDYSPEYWALSADKGAVVMQMLRSTMGDDKFFRGLKDFLQQYAWKSATTEDFRKVVRSRHGRRAALLLHAVGGVERRAGIQAGIDDFPHPERLPRTGQDLAGSRYIPHAGGSADRDRRQSGREAHRSDGDVVGVLGRHVRQAEEDRASTRTTRCCA